MDSPCLGTFRVRVWGVLACNWCLVDNGPLAGPVPTDYGEVPFARGDLTFLFLGPLGGVFGGGAFENPAFSLTKYVWQQTHATLTECPFFVECLVDNGPLVGPVPTLCGRGMVIGMKLVCFRRVSTRGSSRGGRMCGARHRICEETMRFCTFTHLLDSLQSVS